MGDLLMSVKFDDPAIPWTTKTPISKASWEKTIFGSITFIVFYKIFFCPPLGVIVIEQLNFPAYWPTNLSLSFFTY